MTIASTFRKKPVEIQAVELTADNLHQVSEWVTASSARATSIGNDYLLIHTLEGEMRADLGDFVIQGVKGEFYPCKPDIFAATYEAVPR